jgi:NAD(P)-dependent dehydrogenase (short-subunit alcohol dehydrogenase family)
MRLKDKVALVTGGASGIGQATAQLFGKEGASVMIADINEARAREVADSLGLTKKRSAFVTGDVSRSSDAEKMVKATVDAFGRVDVLVNNAGVSYRNALPKGASAEDVWDRVMDVDLKSIFTVSQFAIQEMLRTGGGSIINIASIAGLVGLRFRPEDALDPYTAAKGGVVVLTKNMAVVYAKNNIRVNCVCPGYVKTPLTKALWEDPELEKFIANRHPMARLGRPEEIAYAILFLASDESSFVTGAPLIVDGGYTAW